MEQPLEPFYPPAEARSVLSVSGATLRRMAKDYEQVFGDLPRNPRGDRLYPQEALERVQAARVLRDRGDLVSLEAALRALSSGEASPVDVPLHLPTEATGAALTLILDELRGLRTAVERLEQQNAALSENMKALEPVRSGERTLLERLVARWVALWR